MTAAGTSETLRRAADALREDGWAVLEDVVAPGHLERLNEALEEETARRLAAEPWRRRFLQSPPLAAPFVFGDVVANPQVVAVTRNVLGAGVYCNLYSTNTNCPGSTSQPVHVDAGQLWPELRQGHPPATLAVNIPLIPATAENGTIEIWPGTHLDTRATYQVDPRDLAARRGVAPPIVLELPLGSVLLRDLRLWHRGLANPSSVNRHMLTMNHNVFWLERGPKVRFISGCEASFAGTELAWHAEFVDGPASRVDAGDPP